jgi:hypothetical protein
VIPVKGKYDYPLAAACVSGKRELANVRRIEIDKIDTGIGKFFPIGKPFQIIAEVKAVHFFRSMEENAASSTTTVSTATARPFDKYFGPARQESARIYCRAATCAGAAPAKIRRR